MDAEDLTRRLPKLGPAVWIMLVLAVLGFGLWTLLRPADLDASLRWQDGRLVGNIEGFVAGVDSRERRVDISSSRFGFDSIALVVTDDTTIVVHGKQGGLGDLWKDLTVRVTYELHGDVRMAKAIEVGSIDQEPATVRLAPTPSESVMPMSGTLLQPGPARADAAPPAALPPATAAPAETPAPPRVVSPPPTVPARSARAPRPGRSPRATPAPDSAVGGSQEPARWVREPAGARGSGATASDRRTIEPQTGRTAGAGEPDKDGSDAVEWLFKEGSRR
jgi:hypothetical protein